jgi:hypothetical protein
MQGRQSQQQQQQQHGTGRTSTGQQMQLVCRMHEPTPSAASKLCSACTPVTTHLICRQHVQQHHHVGSPNHTRRFTEACQDVPRDLVTKCHIARYADSQVEQQRAAHACVDRPLHVDHSLWGLMQGVLFDNKNKHTQQQQ